MLFEFISSNIKNDKVMKTLILKGLLVLGFVLGLSAIACAQDGEKPVYKLRTVENVKVSDDLIKELREIKTNRTKEATPQKVRLRVPVKDVRYERYELKKEVE
jgi:hypothetical protein